MRLYHYLIVSLVLVLFVEARAAVRLPLNGRQDDTPSSQPQSEPSKSPESTRSDASQLSTSSVRSEVAESTGTPSTRQTQAPSDAPTSTTSLATSTTTTQATETDASHGAQSSETARAEIANPLPIPPKITPAIGITGVILLLSGVVYAVIGIKNKWLYVFFSAAYLISLTVTVLVVYLMNPPVSNAVQGGFFIAAFLTGVIFGGISLVFSDITDGLGCLLGGFCLSMWFLSLRPGGLIKSTTGRAIFIGVMSVATYCLSFSHYTRTYGLIGSIAFSGATATVLGIDCFSRAGWKEFWIYLWDLKPEAFPLHTNTYPMTRGIKVELAAIVLLTVFAVLSQLRLWKMVKERREESAATRLEREQNIQREDTEIGRRVVDDLSREQVKWEATYGDKSRQQDSVIDSSHKGSPKTSMSIREQDVYSSDSVEMVTLPLQQKADNRKSASKRASVTVRALKEEDEIQQIDSEGNPISPFTEGFSETVITAVPKSASPRGSVGSSVANAPEVVPLPFTIPKEDDGNEEDDNASLSAVAESVHDPVRRSLSQRLSGGSVLKRFSKSQALLSDVEESLIIPHVEDDRSSSVAATMDDDYDNLSDLSELAAPKSPVEITIGGQSVSTNPTEGEDRSTKVGGSPGGKTKDLPESRPAGRAGDLAVDGKDGLVSTSEVLQPLRHDSGRSDEKSGIAGDNSLKTEVLFAEPAENLHILDPRTRQSLTISTNPKSDAAWSDRKSSNASPRLPGTIASEGEETGIQSSSPTSQSGSPVVLSKDALPHKLSKVALSYRTNEWAKHLELAEQPELDELPEPGSPGTKLINDSEELPAPVNDQLRGLPPPKISSRRTSTGTNPYRNSNPIRSASNMSRYSVLDSAVGGSSRPISTSKRSSSTPFPTPSPELLANARSSHTPSPLPSNTLLAHRETLVQNKVSTHSLTPVSSSSTLQLLDPENMTLAQRKQLIQQQKPPSVSQSRRQSNWAMGEQIQGFDSHQPRRSSGSADPNRREVMLAGWRESIRKEVAPVPKPTEKEDEARRLSILNERRQKEMEKQQREMIAQQRESMMGNMMRSGEMLDAHREAMRRLQAKANRNAS